MNARIANPALRNRAIVSNSNTNSTPEVSMNTKTALVTRNDVQPAVQGEKAEAYRVAEQYALHAGESMFGDRSYLRARAERNGRPLVSEIEPKAALPLRKPADGLISQFEYDEEKRYGYLYVSYGKSFSREERDAHRSDTKYSDRRFAIGALNVLRLALIDSDLHYGGGIMTRYANQITENTGYFKTKGAVAYVKGCDVGRLIQLSDRGVRGNGWVDADYTYKVEIGHDGALVVDSFACSSRGNKNSPEGFEMQFVVYQTLEDGNGVLISVGPDTYEKAFAIHSYIDALNKVDNARLSDKAKDAIRDAAMDIYARLVSERYEERASREVYAVQKAAAKKVNNDLSAPQGAIVVPDTVKCLFNGQQIHITAEFLIEEISAGRPIVKYARTAEALEGKGWNYTDLRRQPNLAFTAEVMNKTPKLHRKSVAPWK